MKRKFFKSLFCFVLAGFMWIGDAGNALAAGIAPEAEEITIETQEEKKHSQELEKTDETISESTEKPADVPEDSRKELEGTVDTSEASTEIINDTEKTPEDLAAEEGISIETPKDEQEEAEGAEDENPDKDKAPDKRQESEEKKIVLEAAEVSEMPDYMPEIKSMNLAWKSSASNMLTVTWRGTGWRFEIYVNGKHEISKYNPENENQEMSGEFGFQTTLGTSYTVKIISYSRSGRKGAEKTAVNKRNFGTLTQFTGGKSSGYEDEKEYGYYIPGVYLSWDYSGPGPVEYEVWRSTRKDTGYRTIATVTEKQYKDKGLVPGTYYYKIKLFSRANQTQITAGSLSQPFKVEVENVSAWCQTALDEKGRVVISCGADKLYVYGYDIYRSSKRNSDYRKIATTSNDTYTDYSAQKGKTYYYKVKGFYYNTKNKKIYRGDSSKAKGIKVVNDDFVIEKARAISTSKVNIKWKKVSGADEYRIYYKSANAGERFRLLASTKKISYTKSGLTSGQSYYFQIHAYRKKKEYAVSDIANVTVGLAEPQNFMVSGRTYSYKNSTYIIKNKLTWDRVYGADGYYLQMNNQGWETIKKLKSSSTSYTYMQYVKDKTDTGVELRLVAYKGKVQYKGNKLQIPVEISTVTGISVKQKGNDSAVISWKKSAGAKTYSVYRLLPNADYVWVGNVEGTSITDTGLNQGINYTYWVKVRYLSNGLENMRYIPSIREGSDFKTFALSVSRPSISSVKNTNTGGAVIKWKKTSTAQKYVIYRSESKSGSYKKIKTVGAKATSYTDSNLKEGKYYYYKVRAYRVNSIGGDVYSDYSDYKRIKIVLYVAKPFIISIKNTYSKKAVITWKKASTAQRYEIYRAESKKGLYKKIKTVSAKTTSYTDSKLKKGKGYYYKVRAYRVSSTGKKVYSSYSSYRGIKIKK